MKHRSPAAPLLLPLITLGIYSLVWYAKTKSEMNRANQGRIPTLWLIIIPFVSIWWLWRYAVGVKEFTQGAFGAGAAFWLNLLLGPIGNAIVQSGFNSEVHRREA